MRYSIRVKIEERSGDLMGKLPSSLLSYLELSFFQVGKQITAIQLFHDDVDVILILKNVQQADNVRMLAHFEDLNLTSLKLNILD